MVEFSIKDLNIYFDSALVLKNVTMEITANEILSIIGPSNSGKTTFLRMLNRLNELSVNFKMSGRVEFKGQDIKEIDAQVLRKKVGMVFALPLPLPLSVFDNVAYGLKIHGIKNKGKEKENVVQALKQAYLWEEVKDRLDESAFKLSGGQQQRLCIARTLAV